MNSTPVVNRAASVLPYLSWGTHDPTVVATHGIPGMIYIQVASWQDITAPVGIFQKTTTAGEDTNWIAYGTGSTSISDYKDPVDYASTADIALSGAFPLAIDGASLTALDAGSRLLLKDQALSEENGIYELVDDGGGNYLLERSSDANTDALVTFGMFTWVINGVDNELTGWILTTQNPITLDTTPLTFAQIPVVSPGAVVYTPAVPSNWPITPTNVQQALDEAAALINYASPFQIYVDATNGDDATGTGSVLRPYQSLQQAISVYGAAPVGRYTIQLAPGDYGGAPIAIPSQLNKSLSIVGTGNTVNISALLSYTSTGPASDESFVMDNIGVQSPIDIDFTLAVAPCLFFFVNGGYNINRIDTLAPGPQFVKVINSVVGYVQTNSVVQILNSQFTGGPPSNIGATGFLLLSNTIFSFMSGVLDGSMLLIGCITGGTVLTGSGSASGDASSLDGLNLTGPTAVFADKAQYVGYTPSTPANWNVAPTTTKEALDELAARNLVVEERTVSAPEAAAKQLVLSNTPFNVNEVGLAYLGLEQTPSVDFSVTGSTLDWNGLGLDTIGVVAGDIMVLTYQKE